MLTRWLDDLRRSLVPDRDTVSGEPGNGPAAFDPRLRLRVCAWAFLAMLAVVFARVVQLEVTQGAAFRAQAAKPLVRRTSLPAVRGRILTRGGVVLACDRKVASLAVEYRYLEDPVDEPWLKRTARARLSQSERKDPRRVAEAETRLREERVELARRLAALAGITIDEWTRRARRIQARVERIAEAVNRRRQAEYNARTSPSGSRESTRDGSRVARFGRFLLESIKDATGGPPERITVAEELDCHVVVDDLPAAIVAEIRAHPSQYGGARLVERVRRDYPAGPLAAHLLGYLGPPGPEELRPGERMGAEDRVGRSGLERQCETLLRARPGTLVETADRSGRVLSSRREQEPQDGRDLVLTLDPALQAAAERLLEAALGRRIPRGKLATRPHAEREEYIRKLRSNSDADPNAPLTQPGPAGGAIVVIDAQSGAILAAASAPGFDPNVFAEGREDEAARLLGDPGHPLFNRVASMALAPGSVFKVVTSMALLDWPGFDPAEPYFCQGYLRSPQSRRCAIYTRSGKWHGDVALCDALSESCNTYFFHHAGHLRPDQLVDWAGRFGFGRPTGCDLADETRGVLPGPANIAKLEGHPWSTRDTEALAVGQGSLVATPLQVVRMMAAVANGGFLVTPHVVDGQPGPATQPIPGLSGSMLAAIHEGLKRVVHDPRGTAYATVRLPSIAIAGKTGTAETGEGQAEHAWFAGYVPAEKPKLAFVVVLEHAGDAAEAAGPVARRLVEEMERLKVL